MNTTVKRIGAAIAVLGITASLVGWGGSKADMIPTRC